VPPYHRAITFLRVPAVAEDRRVDYETWYDSTHIPLRMAQPGFNGAQRYEVLDGPQRYIVVYELEDVTAPEGAEYTALRNWESSQPTDSFEAPALTRPGFERGIYEQLTGPTWPSAELQAPILHCLGHDLNGADMTWFANELQRQLGEVPGVAASRYFEHTEHDYPAGTGMLTPFPRALTLVYVDRQDVLASADYQQVVTNARTRLPRESASYAISGRRVFGALGDEARP
jgi:hypothetical protein